jgi:hypothetical protein
MVHRRAYDNLNQSRFADERGFVGGREDDSIETNE